MVFMLSKLHLLRLDLSVDITYSTIRISNICHIDRMLARTEKTTFFDMYYTGLGRYDPTIWPFLTNLSLFMRIAFVHVALLTRKRSSHVCTRPHFLLSVVPNQLWRIGKRTREAHDAWVIDRSREDIQGPCLELWKGDQWSVNMERCFDTSRSSCWSTPLTGSIANAADKRPNIGNIIINSRRHRRSPHHNNEHKL